MDIKYKSDKPYPEVHPNCENRWYAELLLEDYAGAAGKLTSFSQYIYHSTVNAALHPDVSETLNRIAQVELHHMQLLGSAIMQLGVHPVYRGSGSLGRNYWSGKHVAYGQTLSEQLKADLHCERESILSYKRRIEQIDIPDIQSLLLRLIEDEKIHEDILMKLLK